MTQEQLVRLQRMTEPEFCNMSIASKDAVKAALCRIAELEAALKQATRLALQMARYVKPFGLDSEDKDEDGTTEYRRHQQCRKAIFELDADNTPVLDALLAQARREALEAAATGFAVYVDEDEFDKVWVIGFLRRMAREVKP